MSLDARRPEGGHSKGRAQQHCRHRTSTHEKKPPEKIEP
jgi:hypothetical protein